MLGQLRTGAFGQHAAGVLVVAGMVSAWARLHLIGIRLKSQEQQSRWASTLRDLLNLLLIVTLTGGFYLAGLPGPAAFLFAGTIGIGLDVLRHATPDDTQRTRIILLGAFPIALLIALFPAPALLVANAIVGILLA